MHNCFKLFLRIYYGKYVWDCITLHNLRSYAQILCLFPLRVLAGGGPDPDWKIPSICFWNPPTECPAKHVPLLLFIISQLPIGLEIPSWTFFNSPICVDFKDIEFFIIWWNLELDMVEILKVISKVHIFSFIVESRTWPIRFNQECSRALRSTQK